jgi:cold shock CspA family protein
MKARDFGEVAFWNGNSFGFIKTDAVGPDVFFHVSELPEGQDVRRGVRVEYTLSVDPFKPVKERAVQVRLVNGEAHD